MNSQRWILVAAGIALMGFVRGDAVPSDYAVSEIVRVLSPAEFECRIAGYAYTGSVRFRVQVRDVVVNPQMPADEAAEYLYERLKAADRVVLQQVQFRNYFRLRAAVSLDGKDLRQELLDLGLAMPVPSVETTTSPSPPQRRYRPPASGPSPAPARAKTDVNRRGITLESLLAAKVDLSAINETTTLQEALEILSDSVRPRVPFVVLWNDLETNALIDKNIPVGAGGFGELPLKQALKIILHSVSRSGQMKLHLAIEGGVVTIGTQKGLLQKATVQSYAVEDLISPPFDEDAMNQQGRQGY